MSTSRQLRRERREAERKARKAEYQAAKTQARIPAEADAEPVPAAAPELEQSQPENAARSRAEVNRANAQHSTGPRSFIGKHRSSQNSFRHGLYSTQLIMPGEDPVELDTLKADLIAEHQPANQTEHILVNEIAEQYWRIRRMRELEARAFTPENLDSWMESGLLTLIQRTMASAERGLHKALNQLRSIQNAARPQPDSEIGFVSQNAPSPNPDCGFVPEFSYVTPSETLDFSRLDPDPDDFGPDLTPLLPPKDEILDDEAPIAA